MVLCEELKTKIPSKEGKFCYGAPYIDRFYNTTPAGTRKECSKLTVKHCLEHLIRPPSPEVVRKLNSWCNPGVGERRTFHALINDPQLKEARDMRHGLVSKDRFDPTKTFGLKYRSDPRGTFVRRALNWVSEDQAKFQSPVMSQRQFDFNERYHDKLGKVRDPKAQNSALLLSQNCRYHESTGGSRFWSPLASGELTVGQLLHGRVPREIIGLPFENITEKSTATTDQLCLDTGEQRTMLLSVVHHALRRAAFGRGPEMTAVMCQRQKESVANLIPMTEARMLFSFFDVPLDEELTELVFDTVSVEAPPDMVEAVRKTQREKVPKNVLIEKTLGNSDQTEWAVDWRLLAAFLDCNRQIGGAEWTKLKDCGCAWIKSQKAERFEPVDAVRRRLRKAIDANVLTFTTSNGQYQGESEGLVPSDCWLRLGKPPVLRNRPVPKVTGKL
ncbi:hypothetical protein FGIG_11888 [Fasciola gigantica]|uniref:Uncharacterized protein n=1 Tax=Fasciola gigantica TaxID=46835 RepID=A0A504YH48_FASGI|nr:hypothetical protein FGIG_11888 [Fasciola gigantica]